MFQKHPKKAAINRERASLTIACTMPKPKANKIEIISLTLINSAIVHLPCSFRSLAFCIGRPAEELRREFYEYELA